MCYFAIRIKRFVNTSDFIILYPKQMSKEVKIIVVLSFGENPAACVNPKVLDLFAFTEKMEDGFLSCITERAHW